MRKSISALEEEIERLNRESSILSTIAQTINQSVDLHEILNNSLDKITELTEVNAVGLYLLDEREKELVLAAQRGFSKSFSKGMRMLRLGEGLSGKVTLSGEAFVYRRLSGLSRCPSFDDRRRGEIDCCRSLEVENKDLRNTGNRLERSSSIQPVRKKPLRLNRTDDQ